MKQLIVPVETCPLSIQPERPRRRRGLVSAGLLSTCSSDVVIVYSLFTLSVHCFNNGLRINPAKSGLGRDRDGFLGAGACEGLLVRGAGDFFEKRWERG